MWAVAGVLGFLALVTGVLPLDQAHALLDRTAPVLAFLVAVTVLADLADAAGLFDLAAGRVARAARGRTLALWLGVALLATTSTVLLSLDTTAVLLTPVVLGVTSRCGLPAEPFAVLVLWLANTASLLLPLSNLTNLLAASQLHLSPAAFAGRFAFPAVACVLATVVILLAVYRVRGRYTAPATEPVGDRLLVAVAALCCLSLVPGALLGLPAWTIATPAALLLAGVSWARGRRPPVSVLPWRLVLLTSGLFVVVAAAGRLGLDDLVRDALGDGGAARTAAVATVGANTVNNLPAYLSVSAVARPQDVVGLLIGVDAGPLVTVWASLATLLWRERCKARGFEMKLGRLTLLGLLGAPVIVASGVLAARV